MKTSNKKKIASNLYVESVKGGVILYSYETRVAFYEMESKTFYQTTEKYSHTTTCHISKWRNEKVKGINGIKEVKPITPKELLNL